MRNICIYGAGSAGKSLYNALKDIRFYRICFFVDDFSNNSTLFDLPVVAPSSLQPMLDQYEVKEIFIAIPSVSFERRHEILDEISKFGLQVSIVDESVISRDGIATNLDLRDVNISELTGRNPICFDLRKVRKIIDGRVVLITGAGGSIGNELTRQVLSLAPETIIAIDQSEYNLYALQEALDKLDSNRVVRYFLRDVKDTEAMEEIFSIYRPNIVFHAAAYKHVPIVEANIIEGVGNNIISARTILRLCAQFGIDEFVLVSTDKAVRPTNYMGASKRICELMMSQFAGAENWSTRCVAVRFGNVVGSSGSVVPKFIDQIRKGGPITVTHPEITRFFMTIPEACHLVIQTLAVPGTLNIFLLDMGSPIKVVDIAKKLIQLSGYDVGSEGVDIVFTGLRPGEKLYEELLIVGAPEPTEIPLLYRGENEFVKPTEFQATLEDLLHALHARNSDMVKDLVQALVPDFSNAVHDGPAM